MRFWLILIPIGLFYSLSYGQVNVGLARKYMEEGATYFNNREYVKAIEKFKASYEISRHPARLQNIARCYELLNEPAEAIEYYVWFAFVKPDRLSVINQILLKMIIPYLNSPKIVRQSKIREWGFKLADPKIGDNFRAAWVISALTYYKSARYEQATQLFNRLLNYLAAQNLAGPLSNYFYQQGQIKLAAENYPAAANIFEFSILLGLYQADKIASNYMSLGAATTKKKQYAQALKFYQTAHTFARAQVLKDQIRVKLAEVSELLKKQATTVGVDKYELSPAAQKKRKAQQIAGWTIFGVGAVATIVSIAMFVLAKKADDSAESNYKSYEDALSQADMDKFYSAFSSDQDRYKTYMMSAYITGAIGLVGLTVGIVLVVLARKRSVKTAAVRGILTAIKPVINTNSGYKAMAFEWAF